MRILHILLASCALAASGYAQPDLTIANLNKAGVVTDTQTLAVSGTLIVTIKNIGTTAVSAPFQVVAWEDRDGNGQFNSGTDVTLGSLLYSAGLNAGASADVSLPLSGTVLFRGNLIYAQVDAGNAVAESIETNNIANTGQFTSPAVKSCTTTAPNGMALTANAMAQGFCLSAFADNFPSTGFCCGPFGIAFPVSGGVLVSDAPGNVRLFPLDVDGQHADAFAPAQNYGHGGAFGLIKSSGSIYLADQANGRLLRLNDNGTLNSIAVSGTPNIQGLTVNPNNNHVFASGSTGIWDIDPVAMSATRFNTVDADGLTMSADGTVIYGAVSNHILGFRLSDASQVFDSGVVSTVDGTALGGGSIAGSIFANTNDGRIVQTILATGQQILIASGGSRGDFVSVDPNGTLLLTQTDAIYRLAPPPGASFSALPDLTSSFIRKNDSAFPSSVQLTARIGNGGAMAATTALGPNLLQNGSFELSNSACSVNSSTSLAPGSVALTGWTVIGQQIHVVGNGVFHASDGNCSLDFTNINPGAAVEQTIPTVPGGRYALTLAMTENPTYNIGGNLTAIAANQTYGFAVSAFPTTPGLPIYTNKVWEFVAADFLTVLHLESTTYNTLSGPVIDGLEVHQVLNPQNPLPFGFYNTGVNDAGVVIPSGVDPHYSLIASPIPAGANLTTGYQDYFWVGPDAASTWITDSVNGNPNEFGDYTYRFRFNLSGVIPATVRLFGQVSSDNHLIAIRLNNVDTGASEEAESPSLASYQRWSDFAITGGFVAGQNTLDFTYHEDGTVHGLRVEFLEVSGEGNASGPVVPVSFYNGDPASGGTLIGTTQTSKGLLPGQYDDVSVTWSNPAPGLYPIVVVADPNNLITESDKTNNKAGANILLGVGPFVTVDDLTARFKSTEVDLRWSAITGATGYNVYRRSGSASPTLLRSHLTTTALADTGLTNGTIYYYSARWLDSTGKESGDGTEASGTPTASTTSDTPPTILSSPVVRATALTAYSYAVRASDPDVGDALTYSIISPPVGMAISTAGLITWTPTTLQGGYSRIQLQVQDKKGHLATQSYSLFVDVQIVNQPPVISSTPITLSISGQPYAYQVLGRDPQNGLLFYALDSAPTGMTINQSTGLIQWTPTRAQIGSQSVVLHTTDFAGLSTAQSFTISVGRGNKAPQFTSVPLTNARAGQLYVYPAAAADPESDPITFSLATAPTGMTVNAGSGLVQWTPTTAQVGQQTVSLRVADDSGLNSLQNFVITVRAANQPPSITSTPITTAQTSTLYSYPVTAADPDLPNDALTFSFVVFPAGMTIGSNTGLIQWTPSASVQNTTQNVTVQVNDLAGASASQAFQIKVTAPDTTPPTVSIATPSNGAQVTNDTVITGTATDANLKNWVLEYQISGASTWTTLSTGTSPVVNGTLGTLPATLLANDPYQLRLTASDFTQSSSATIEVNVNTGQLKLGDFTLSFEDIRVPGFTFPISVLRKYDSKRTASGDFGPGWTLGFSEVDVRTSANNDVTMTLPDGRRVTFTSAPISVGFGVFNTNYTGQNGVIDTLQNLDCPQVLGSPGNFLCNGFQPWTPQNYLLTTKEGVKYTVNAQSGIQRIEDRVGNFIQIATTGVTSNFGRNVTFQRDLSGKIVSMTEPTGGQTKYGYDSTGRLTQFTDQAGNGTTFFYENTQFPNYLTKIVDPLGRPVTRSVYDSTGRLIAQCDANGNVSTLAGCVRLTSQPVSQLLSTVNARGFKTDLFLDSQGNVLTERHWLDSTNFLDTVRTYDANNNMLTEKDPAGNTKVYTYDARKNKLSDTDQGGHKTSYTYTACDRVAIQTDAAGNLTTYAYDSMCNLRFVTDALNNTTEYRYNAAGQKTQFIDSLGSIWTWTYDSSGLVTSLADPFGKATKFSFNSSGDLLTRTDRIGRQISFQYDAAHHTTKETWSTGRVASFAYTATGQIANASDPDSAFSTTYDTLGRLQSIDNQGSPGAPRIIITYGYDAEGNVTSIQDSLGGMTAYSYDALGHLSRVTQSGTNVQPKRMDMLYDASSTLVETERFGDLSGTAPVANTFYRYQCGGCANRVTAILHRKPSDGSVLHDLTFARDFVGNITSSVDAEGAHVYQYDAIRRLTMATHPAGGLQPNEVYTYDVGGNRLTSHLSNVSTYSWQTMGMGSRLLQDSQFTYTYDDEGNLLQKMDRASGAYTIYTYDCRNRLTAVIEYSSSGAQLRRSDFAYDIFNRRLHSVDNGYEYWNAYDAENPILKLTTSGIVITRRLYSLRSDAILAEDSNNATNWLLTDQVLSVRDLIQTTGTVAHLQFDSFGRLLQNTSVGSTQLGFDGREFDSDGLGYFRQRYYDSSNGRFIGSDEIQPYAYAYVKNNPLSFTDVTGTDEAFETVSLSSSVRTSLNSFTLGQLNAAQQTFASDILLSVGIRAQFLANSVFRAFAVAGATLTPCASAVLNLIPFSISPPPTVDDYSNCPAAILLITALGINYHLSN